jgi:hypothetical protein
MEITVKLADKIRSIATTKHVIPAVEAGKREFSIAVRDLIEAAKAEGIATVQRTPPFCTSIQTQGFLTDNHLEIVRVDGPAKKQSTRVVVHYRTTRHAGAEPKTHLQETPEERAFRLTEKIRGLMKDEIAAHGGGESYLRWVRGEDEEAA